MLIIVLVAAAAVGYGLWRRQGGVAAAAKAAAALGRTATVKEGDITLKVSETGTLESVTIVDVKSRVAGRVQRMYVNEGDRVAAGQLLAVVDPEEVARQVAGIQAQLDAARASLRQAEESYAVGRRQNRMAVERAQASLAESKARLKQTAAPTRPQEIDQAESAVRRAEAQIADAKRNYNRKKALVDKGFVAAQEADSAQTQIALAEADLASAQDRVSLLRAGARREDIDTARASVRTMEVQLAAEKANSDDARLRLRDVERARAQVAQIENQLAQQSVQLAETRIVAPIGGEIIGKHLEEGELVASATAGFAQGAALVTIADLSRMQVRVNVNEVDVTRIRTGLPVEVRVDGVPNAVFPGKVTSISPASLGQDTKAGQQSASGGGQGQNAVVRFEVKVTVTQPDKRLRPGMSAAVDILTDRRKNSLLLPAEALGPNNTVTVVTGAGETLKREKRTVQVGLKNEAQAEILSGVRAGERVEIPKIEAKDRRKINLDGPN